MKIQKWEDPNLPKEIRAKDLEAKKWLFMHLIPFGLFIGSMIGGYVIRYSRKYTFIIVTLIGMIASGISVINNI